MTADPPSEHRNEAHAEPIASAGAGAARERRRPGRLERVSPALIALLRSQPNPEVMGDEDQEARNALVPMQGILLAAVVGLLMWAGLFLMIKGLLH